MHRLILLLALTTVAVPAAWAQSALAAPMPGAAKDGDCMTDYIPLREDAEKKGKRVREAGDRHAPPEETCRLIRDYSVAEDRMIGFMADNSETCGIQAAVIDQTRSSHRKTEALLEKVCASATRNRSRDIRFRYNDFGDPSLSPRKRGLGF